MKTIKKYLSTRKINGNTSLLFVLIILSFFLYSASLQSNEPFSPVNPNASPEARLLLRFLYQIQGKYILAGQHNYPCTLSEFTEKAKTISGRYPALWGQDFGFTLDDKDGIVCRQAVIDEAVRQHSNGVIITLMWHAVRPVDDEPNGWEESVQAELSNTQWDSLVTRGTALNKRWLVQLDTIACYLGQLRDARVPVLWRPYHEMNGQWFWWGQKKGPNGYILLWKMLQKYLIETHGLNNLLWVWNPNSSSDGTDSLYHYFPGINYVDVLAMDIYRHNFEIPYYEELCDLAGNKPVAIGECAQMPSPEILIEEPRFTWFMVWSEFIEKSNTQQHIKHVFDSERVITLDKLNNLRFYEN